MQWLIRHDLKESSFEIPIMLPEDMCGTLGHCCEISPLSQDAMAFGRPVLLPSGNCFAVQHSIILHFTS